MRSPAKLALLGAIGGLAAALAAGPASASDGPAPAHAASPPTAVFVQTDDPAGNTIVAYDRGRDGTLTRAGAYPTGGLGGVLDGSVVDHLASQGSLAYDRRSRNLYAVNAGSDTITVFAVDGDRLSRTQTLPSGGTFPVSIATHGRLVYVLNALDGGSIQGYYRLGHHLKMIPRFHRELGLTEDSPQFTHTPGQVAFTPNGSRLIVTTKAAGNSIEVFRILALGRPSLHPVVNYEAGTVPFAVTFDPAGRLAVTEAATSNVTTYRLSASGVLRLVDQVATGQAATCWIVRDGDYLYASNAGSANLSTVYDDGRSPLSVLGTTTTDAGTVDAAVTRDGDFLYVETGAAGILDEYRVSDGALTQIGSVTVPGAVGGEGIVAL